ncbi:autotransporter domain-containing protein [[Pseudomonas] carboxydohydrogena]|uniref:Autotransporter domain-containing protein n=1 Tax=Afipia carboxydohydrogena TaxID=290 RepID=A0ABY8BLH0_AFICR|nr:outer membrane beta-barrel protein [[Pseudomonas] carboxydohydrogena]WEF50843.1 autotransporter domain-containing protein [[Pseudomonas] carboxydohydrogena]
MKKFLLGTVALIALGSAANAADLAARYTKAPVVAPVSNWTGFYVSGGFGYGLMSSDQHSTTAGVATSLDSRMGGRGYFGTVGLGYDYQLTPAWVVGVFGDAQFGDIRGSLVDIAAPAISGRLKNDANYAAGARLGYLVAPNVLSYVNAGYSYGQFKGSTFSDGVTAIGKSHRDGWFIGGGVENDLNFFGIKAPGWFMKTEYRVTEYDRKNSLYNDGSGNGISFKPYVQTVSTSLVYRFNSHVTPGASAGTPFYTKAARSPAYNWTGFYLAGGGGYGQMSSDQHTVDLTTGANGLDTRAGGRGYFGTIGGGYDWQINPTWVVGVFGDAQFGDIRGSLADAAAGVTGRLKNDTNYAAGARLGYLISPNALSYVNVGYSHADFKSVAFSDGTSIGKSHRDGWFIGGGVENDLNLLGIHAPGWFMKTEYRVAEYDHKTSQVFDAAGVATTGGVAFKPYVQTVSTSLVYRFNWGSPVVAKY